MQYFLTSTGRVGCYVRKDKFDQRLAGARSFAPRTIKRVKQLIGNDNQLIEAVDRAAAPALNSRSRPSVSGHFVERFSGGASEKLRPSADAISADDHARPSATGHGGGSPARRVFDDAQTPR